MKVLWLSNLILPQAAEELGMTHIQKEGWVEGLLTAMASVCDKETEIAVAFPVSEEHDGKRGNFRIPDEEGMEVSYYCFYEDTSKSDQLDPALEGRMNRILDEFRPDVIHIFGTEFPHAYAMCQAAHGEDFHYNPGREKILITFQGVCSAIAADYMACLPDEVVSSTTFRDAIRRDSIKQQQEKFHRRAENELKSVSLAGHVGGRTSFDKKWAKRLGPEAVYHYAGEVMRPVFYEDIPSVKRDENVIFMSGADYPLKGLHILLRALKDVNWPELKIRVAGQDIVSKSRIKISEYGKYLGEMIEGCGLQGKVTFLGRITASEMRDEYLKCGMYVCPSVIENSPNSIVEASLLETPVIAARVGGIPDIIADKKECLLYDCNARKPLDEVAGKLRECIEAVKCDPEAAEKRAKAARERMLKDHDPVTVAKGILKIYEDIKGTAPTDET